MKPLLLSLSLLLGAFFSSLQACDCGFAPELTRQECFRVDAIFEGKVEHVGACENDENRMTIVLTEAFRGVEGDKIEVIFDCGTTCGMKFAPGEKWIFYAEKNNAQELSVSFCSRTRKYITNRDPAEAYLGNSYEEEHSFLKMTFAGTQKQGALGERQFENKVNMKNIPILLGVSLIVCLIGFYFVRKMK